MKTDEYLCDHNGNRELRITINSKGEEEYNREYEILKYNGCGTCDLCTYVQTEILDSPFVEYTRPGIGTYKVRLREADRDGDGSSLYLISVKWEIIDDKTIMDIEDFNLVVNAIYENSEHDSSPDLPSMRSKVLPLGEVDKLKNILNEQGEVHLNLVLDRYCNTVISKYEDDRMAISLNVNEWSGHSRYDIFMFFRRIEFGYDTSIKS